MIKKREYNCNFRKGKITSKRVNSKCVSPPLNSSIRCTLLNSLNNSMFSFIYFVMIFLAIGAYFSKWKGGKKKEIRNVSSLQSLKNKVGNQPGLAFNLRLLTV